MTTRRLAAILAADVVGYSRLIEQDEAGTLAALKERRRGILQPLVAEHHGRIVKVMGDGVLVEFASAVNAVACAVELQKKMAGAKPTRELAAYDHFLRGRERDAYFDLAGAESFYARAIELDPGYVHAHAFRAIALVVQYWLDQQPEKLQRAEACARTALSLDDHDAASHDAMGYVALHQRKFELAGMHLNRAVSLNPNDVYIAADRANWLVRIGRPAEALQSLEAAMQRDPFSPTWFWEVRSNALFHLKRYDEAITALRNMSTFHFWHYAHFAAAYAHAGRQDDARRELTAFLRARPDATIALVAAAEPYAEPALLDHLLDGLRKAGLPE